VNSYTDKAIEILRLTNDGNDLAPRDLYLVQCVVNGSALGVSEADEVAFAELYANVRSGYVSPWFYGIEHLTKDHVGYVYWKGHRVEHYSYRDADAERAAAERLARACRECEERGDEVTFSNLRF
jgi:hypothetical protein